MSNLLSLRDYQRSTIDAFHSKWMGGENRLAAVLPTGAGKTVVFSHLVSEFKRDNPNQRALILAHTDELVTQARDKLKSVAPHLSVGIVKAEKNQVKADVIVASVQTLRNPKRRMAVHDVGLVIVDECHRAIAKTYLDILEHFGCMHEQAPTPVAGFTATLVRGDGGKLSKVWQDVAYRLDISTMIRRGYLLDVRGKRIEVDDLDLRNVKRSGGDYQAADLGEAMTASMAPEIVAKAYAEHASDRSGILFAPTVAAAEVFADELNAQGITTEVVHGALPSSERRAIIARLNAGQTQVVSNCMVLTEGFDSPLVSCVVVARPTRSGGLYQQMVGRALRPDLTRPREGQDALILDVVGASRSHGLASLIDLSPVEIKEYDEDKTLTEWEDVELEELASGPGIDWEFDTHYGPTKSVDFDPLAASRVVWVKSNGGNYFLSVGTEYGAVYVIVAQIGDGYDVLWAVKDKNHSVNGKKGEHTEHRGVGLELAFGWGETLGRELVPGINGNLTMSKTSSWRSRKPTERQLEMCRKMRIEVPEDAKSGDVSNLIDTRIASGRIDPIVEYFRTV